MSIGYVTWLRGGEGLRLRRLGLEQAGAPEGAEAAAGRRTEARRRRLGAEYARALLDT
jgi:hypothetical protein